jgi:hypothetical protein
VCPRKLEQAYEIFWGARCGETPGGGGPGGEAWQAHPAGGKLSQWVGGGAKFISNNVGATVCLFGPEQILSFASFNNTILRTFSWEQISVLVTYLIGSPKYFQKAAMMSMDLDQPVALPSIHQQAPTILCCNCGAPIDGTTAAGAMVSPWYWNNRGVR